MTVGMENEAIGKLLRNIRDCQRQRDNIDAQLSEAVIHLRTAATQIELLIAGQRCATGSPLSRIHMDQLMQLLADRESVQRKMVQAQEALARLQGNRSAAAAG